MFVLQYIMTYHNNYSHHLACRLPPCSNGSAFVFMCHTLLCCVMSSVILYSFMILSNHLFLGFPLLLFPCTCITSSWWYPPLSSLTRGHVFNLPQSFLSEEGCYCFNGVFSPDIFILDVVLLGLASSPSQHSHLSGV